MFAQREEGLLVLHHHKLNEELRHLAGLVGLLHLGHDEEGKVGSRNAEVGSGSAETGSWSRTIGPL